MYSGADSHQRCAAARLRLSAAHHSVRLQQLYGRPFLAPPRIPAARTKELRAAFDASIADPALVADANRFNLELRPMTGEELQAKIEQLYSTSEAVLARARTALEPPKQ